MRRRATKGWALVSWVALASSAAMLVISSRSIWRSGSLPGAAVAMPDAGVSAEIVATAPTAADAALSRDLFRAGGLLPNAVARLRAPADTILPVSVAAVRLLGTIIRTSGSFALCQLPADVPRIVHVGERLGDLTLISLEQGRVVFQAPKGARLELFLSNSRS